MSEIYLLLENITVENMNIMPVDGIITANNPSTICGFGKHLAMKFSKSFSTNVYFIKGTTIVHDVGKSQKIRQNKTDIDTSKGDLFTDKFLEFHWSNVDLSILLVFNFEKNFLRLNKQNIIYDFFKIVKNSRYAGGVITDNLYHTKNGYQKEDYRINFMKMFDDFKGIKEHIDNSNILKNGYVLTNWQHKDNIFETNIKEINQVSDLISYLISNDEIHFKNSKDSEKIDKIETQKIVYQSGINRISEKTENRIYRNSEDENNKGLYYFESIFSPGRLIKLKNCLKFNFPYFIEEKVKYGENKLPYLIMYDIVN